MDDIKLIIKSILDDKDFQKGVSGMGKALKTAEKSQEGFFKTMQNNWLKVSAIVIGVVGTIKKAWAFQKEFAEYEQGMNALAKNTGQNADKIVSRLREVSKGTISNKDIMLAANRSVALGVTSDTDTMAKLMTVATEKAKAMGISSTQAFSDLLTGVGRQSPQILDNLGIMTKGWDSMAKSQGKTLDKQFIINQLLKDSQGVTKGTGDSIMNTAETMEKFTASWKNLEIAIGKFIDSAAGQGIIKFFTSLINYVSMAINNFSSFFNEMKILSQLKSEYNIKGREEIELVENLIKAKKNYKNMSTEDKKDLEYVKAFNNEMSKTIIAVQKATGRAFTDEDLKRIESLINLSQKAVKGESLTPEGTARIQVPVDTAMAGGGKGAGKTKEESLEAYYTYIDDQRNLDLLKEEEAYAKAFELASIHNEDLFLLSEEHEARMDEIMARDYTKKEENASAWVDIMRNAMGNIVSDFSKGITEMIWSGSMWKKSFGEFMNDMLINVGKLITQMLIMTGIQKGLSFLGLGFLFQKGGVVPGYANGGLVYANAGFTPKGTDTVPAMLTPGERVLSLDQNRAFENLIGSLRLNGKGNQVVNNNSNKEEYVINNNFDNKFENGEVEKMIRFSQLTGRRLLRR